MSRKAVGIALTSLLIIMVVAAANPVVAVTWSDVQSRITTALFYEGNPSITQTNDGRIWIVYEKAVLGDNTIFCNTSSNLGTTWSDAENLTYIPEDIIGRHDSRPSIIQATNGTLWLVWASNKPPLPSEPDFSIDALPEELTIPQGGSDNSTIIITSLRSFSELVNLSTRNPIVDVNTTLDPEQVTPPLNGAANSTLTISVQATAIPGNYTLTVLGKSGELEHRVEIALEIIPSGTANLSEASSSSSPTSSEYEMDYEIFCKTSNDNGATWSKRFQITDNDFDDLSPSIIQLKNGTIMIVRQSEEEIGNPNIFYNVTSDGTSWTYGTITSDPGLDRGPSIMQAQDETIWVAWTSNRTGNSEVFSKTCDGLSWSIAFNLTYSINDDMNPSILQTIDGTIWMFWSSRETSSSATGDIYYKYSSDNGATWSDRNQFTTDSCEDIWPAIAQTRDTRIWVVWTSNRANQPDGNWDIYYKTSLAGDVNGDGEVDILDLSIVANACGTVAGQPGYNPDADINKDGRVDIRDLAIVGRDYGST